MDRVKDMADREGLPYEVERIHANSLDALRLLQLAEPVPAYSIHGVGLPEMRRSAQRCARAASVSGRTFA